MPTMAKLFQDEATGNYHLFLRPYEPVDPEDPSKGGHPVGGPEAVIGIEWTPEEFEATCLVIDQYRKTAQEQEGQTEQSTSSDSGSSAAADDGA